MSERIGTCQDCGQRYGDIPDSVTATKVRCKECSGTVVIPPLAAATPPADAPVAPATPATPAAPAAPASPAAPVTPVAPPAPTAGGGLAATPVGDAPKKVDRPAAAAPVDRDVARPAKKAKKAPESKKPAAPSKPLFAPKKPAKPIKPIKPVAKKPVAPVKPIAKKPAAPVKPAAAKQPAAPVKPAVAKKPAAPVKPAAAAPDAEAAKKARAAAIIAKAKAKRAQEEGAAPAEKKSGADVLAALKAKREGGGQAAKPAAASKPAAAAKPAAKKAAGAPKPAAKKKPSAGGTRKSSAKRSSRRDADEEGGRRGSRAAKKSGPPMGLLVFSLVGLIAIVGGYFWWQGQQGDEGTPDNTEATGPQTPGDSGAAAPMVDDAPPPTQPLTNLPSGDSGDSAGSGDPAEHSGNAAPETPDGDTGAGEPEAGAETPSTPTATPSAEFIAPQAGETVSTRGITDFFALDLTQVPLLPKFRDTDDELQTELLEDLELFLEDSGASSNRAGKRVVDGGRSSFPIILNAMLRLDYSTSNGNYTGGTLNQLLYQIGKSNVNVGWKATNLLEEGSEEFLEAALFNKKATVLWFNTWVSRLAKDDAQWEGFITPKKPEDSNGGE